MLRIRRPSFRFRHLQTMTNSALDSFLPGPGLPSIGLKGLRRHKAALALGLAGSGIAALFVSAHWTISISAATVVLVLSALESEAFLLFVVFVTPFVWVLQADVVLRNVSVGLRSLVVIGYFAGKFLRGETRIGYLFCPTVSKASLLFLCAAIAPTILGKGELTHQSARDLYQLSTFIAFYFVVLAWANSSQRISKIVWALLSSTVITALFAFYQQIIGGYSSLWIYLNPQDEYTPPWSGRSPSFMGHPNSFAFYLNLILPLAFGCSALGKGALKRLGTWTFGLGLLALLSTQSLGGLIAFVGMLVLAIFFFSRSRKRALVLLLGLFVLICVAYSLKTFLNPSHTEEAVGFDVFSRLLLWSTAWDEFVHSPVFGVGWSNFAAQFGFDIPSMPGITEPHCIYLQLLAETGLVGLVAFFYLIAYSARQAWRQMNSSIDIDKILAFGVLGAFCSPMLHGLMDVPFFTQSGTLLWMLLALLVASERIQRTSRSIVRSQ